MRPSLYVFATKTFSIDILPDITLYDEAVGRPFRLVVLLLVVAAVVTILLTPTPNDDVLGVMHRNHSALAVVVAIGLLQAAVLIRSRHYPQNNSSRLSLSSNILELVCQHLC